MYMCTFNDMHHDTFDNDQGLLLMGLKAFNYKFTIQDKSLVKKHPFMIEC